MRTRDVVTLVGGLAAGAGCIVAGLILRRREDAAHEPMIGLAGEPPRTAVDIMGPGERLTASARRVVHDVRRRRAEPRRPLGAVVPPGEVPHHEAP